MVHGEADLLPGLVVDRFGDCLSVQFLIKGTERRKAMLVELLDEHFKPRAIVNRSDAACAASRASNPRRALLAGRSTGPSPTARGTS